MPLDHRGFTLFELLVAILMISIGIATGLQVASRTIKLGSQAHLRLLAAKGMQEYELEVLRSKLFGDSALINQTTGLTTCAPVPPPLTAAPPPSSQLPGGTCVYYVEPETAINSHPDAKKVTVKVTWIDSDNRLRSSVISTLITKNGLTNPES